MAQEAAAKKNNDSEGLATNKGDDKPDENGGDVYAKMMPATIKEIEALPLDVVKEKIAKTIGNWNFKKWINDLEGDREFREIEASMGFDDMPVGGADEVQSYHMVLVGNPGTGKTMNAKFYGQYLMATGRMPNAVFQKITAADLVTPFVGGSGKITKKILSEEVKQADKPADQPAEEEKPADDKPKSEEEKKKEAEAVRARTRKTLEALDDKPGHRVRPKIIFIDEAYALTYNDHGREALAEICDYMYENRDRVVMIFAGYPGPMKEMLEKNEGLNSRVRLTIECEDHPNEALIDIFHKMMKEETRKWLLADGVEAELAATFDKLRLAKGKHFGNGRESETLIDNMVLALRTRMYEFLKNKPVEERPQYKQMMRTFTVEDVRQGASHMYAKAKDGKENSEPGNNAGGVPGMVTPEMIQVMDQLLMSRLTQIFASNNNEKPAANEAEPAPAPAVRKDASAPGPG